MISSPARLALVASLALFALNAKLSSQDTGLPASVPTLEKDGGIYVVLGADTHLQLVSVADGEVELKAANVSLTTSTDRLTTPRGRAALAHLLDVGADVTPPAVDFDHHVLHGYELRGEQIVVTEKQVYRQVELPATVSSLADLRTAVGTVRESLAGIDLTEPARRALLAFLDKLDQRESDAPYLTPEVARRLIAEGWLAVAVPELEPTLRSQLEEAVRRATGLVVTARFEGEGSALIELEDAFGRRTHALEQDGRRRTAQLLPHPQYVVEPPPVWLVVDRAADRDEILGASVCREDGEELAAWRLDEGFTADAAAWQATFPVPEKAASIVRGYFPPHVPLHDLDGRLLRLITAHGEVVPVRDGSDAAEIERFLDEAADALPDAPHLDLIGQRLFDYVLDTPDPSRPALVGSRGDRGDVHQTAPETLSTARGGVCRGDCDDLAEVYQTIAARQDRLGHIMAIPAHNAFCFAEQDEAGAWHAYVLHTGPALEFVADELPDALGAAYARFTGGEAYDPTSVVVAIRFAGENQRETWALSWRIFAEPDYAETMIDVQRDWHYRTYHRGVVKMEEFIAAGDHDPANYREIASLATITGQWRRAARYYMLGLEAAPDPTLQADVRVVLALYEAGEHERADALADELEAKMPALFQSLRGGALDTLFALANASMSGDRPQRAAQLLETYFFRMLRAVHSKLEEAVAADDYDPAMWQGDPFLRRLRLQVMGATGMIAAMRTEERFAGQVDEALLARLWEPCCQWLDRFSFAHANSPSEVTGAYTLLGLRARTELGREEFHRRLANTDFPEAPQEHLDPATGSRDFEADLPWIKAAPGTHAASQRFYLREDAETLDREGVLRACDDLAAAHAEGERLGLASSASDRTLARSELLRALVREDAAAVREGFRDLAAGRDKDLRDNVVSLLADLARFFELSWWREILTLWREEVDTKPSYFALAWGAWKADAPEHAVVAAELAVARHPDEEAFEEELAYLRKVVAGADAQTELPELDRSEDDVAESGPVEEIGSYGATVRLPEGWERAQLTQGGEGRDEFARQPLLFAVVLEVELLLFDEEDYRNCDVWLNLTSKGLERDGELELSLDGDIGHARGVFSGAVMGNELTYDVHLVHQQGLAYWFLTWAPSSMADLLSKQTAEIVSSLTLPAADSDWARRAAPTVRELRAGRTTLRLSHRPALLRAAPASDADPLLTLNSADETLAVHVLTSDASGTPAEILDLVEQAVEGSWTPFTERIPTREITVGGRPALRRDFRVAGGGGGALVVVPLEEGLTLDLRFISDYRPESREPLLAEILASVEIEAAPAVDAFPIVEVEEHVEASPRWQQLTATGRRVGTAGRFENLTAMSATEVLAASWRGLTRIDIVAGEHSPITVPEGMLLHTAIVQNGTIHALAQNGAVLRLTGDEWQPVGFEASTLGTAGERGLLSLRPVATREVLGLAAPTVKEHELWLTDPDGEERPLGRFANSHLEQHHALCGSGQSALLASSRRAAARLVRGQGDGGARERLVELPLDGGPARDRGAWHEIDAVRPHAKGWLVLGDPAGAPTGLYLVPHHGDPELLCSGSVSAAVQLPDGALLLASTEGAAADEVELHVLTPDAVRRHGPGQEPLHIDLLEEAAAAALAEVGQTSTPLAALRDRESLDALTAAGDRQLAAHGVELSRDVAGSRRLLDLRGLSRLHLPARVLVTALVARGILEEFGAERAEWISGDPGRDGEPLDHAAATAIQPLTWFDSDYGPSANLKFELELSEGRRMLLGADAAALEMRLQELEVDLAGAARSESPARLATLAAAHSENHHLRRELYAHLAAHGRLDALFTLSAAGVHAARDDDPPIDLQAHLAARLALAEEEEDDDNDLAVLDRELRAAIRRYPTQGGFYLLLGRTHELRRAEHWQEKARRCYEKAIDLEGYGALGTQAEELQQALPGATR